MKLRSFLCSVFLNIISIIVYLTLLVFGVFLFNPLEHSVGATCNIIVTQPRRISAISVAERVAAERAEQLGKTIGYQVRGNEREPH